MAGFQDLLQRGKGLKVMTFPKIVLSFRYINRRAFHLEVFVEQNMSQFHFDEILPSLPKSALSGA